MTRRVRPLSLVLAVLSIAGGCAQMGAPPGGPADETAPSITSTSPAADSTGVRSPFPITITFSEKMDKRSVERGLRVFPPAGRIRTTWSGTTFSVETEKTNAPSGDIGTMAVTISGRAEDSHGLPMRVPYLLTFTSSDSLPRGRIAGTLEGLSKSGDAPPGTVRALRPAPADSLPPELLLETEASLDGAYDLRPLPVDSAGGLLVLAFQDEDGDGELDKENELYGYSDTVFLTRAAPSVDSLSIRLVAFDTPASVAGTALFPDSLDSLVVAFVPVPEADSTRRAVFAEPDSTGSYSVTDLSPGAWRALLLRGSRERLSEEGVGPATPVLIERSLKLAPGEKKTGFDLPERTREPQVVQ